MTYTIGLVKDKDLGDGLELIKSNSMITITREPDANDLKYAKDYKKRYGVDYKGDMRPIAINAHFTKIPGCCSGTMLTRLSFPLPKSSDPLKQGKVISIAKRAKLLKLLMQQFGGEAMLLYVVRSDNDTLIKAFNKAGWKKGRGPVGKYRPYNYTLDTYTVDPRTPKKRLPSVKKKVVTKAQTPPVVYTGWRKYIGFSMSNVKRRLGELRR